MSTGTDLDGAQKAAVLLMALGTERAAKVLQSLRESEVTEIMAEVARIETLRPELVEGVIEELTRGAATRGGSSGGASFARELLTSSMGSARGNQVFEQISIDTAATPFGFLRQVEPPVVASFLDEEHPQTIAVMISHLPPDSALAILSQLPESLQREVAVRVATMERSSPEVVARVEAVLRERLQSALEQTEFVAADGMQALVDLLTRADRETETLIIDGIRAYDPDLAERIRNQMFRFDDIVQIDDRAMQQVLRQAETKDLALALKGADETVRAKITANISARAAENLLEEIELLGAVRLVEVEGARNKIVSVVRAMEEAGEITLRRAGDDFIE